MGKQVAMSTIRMEVENVTTAPEFSVTDAGKVVGDLRVSKGGAFWRSKGAQQYLHLSWEQLDQLFKANGTPRAVGEYKFAPPAPVTFDEF
jgi:hypothetical protein